MEKVKSDNLLRLLTLPCGLFVAGISFLLALEKLIAGDFGFTFDDGWIFAQYARNLASGHGFCFNIGEPSSGFTSFLWLLLCAAAYKLTGEFVLPMKLMGILFGAGCVVMTILILRELNASETQQQVGAIMVALCAPLLSGSLSGLETTLGVFMALLAFWWQLKNRHSPSIHWVIQGVLWGAAILARPENFALWLICFVVHLWQQIRAKLWRQALAWLSLQVLIVFLIISPWLWLNFSTTGTPFPTTYLAKAIPRQKTIDEEWGFPLGRILMLLYSLGEFTMLIAFSQPVLFGYFLWLLLVRRKELQLQLSLPLVSAFALLALQAFSNPAPKALVWSYFSRYVLMNSVLCLMGIAMWLPNSKIVKLGAVVGSLIFLFNYAELHPALVKHVRDLNVGAGKWLAVNLPDGETIATHDIGAIAFFSNRRVFDTQGLIHPEITSNLWQMFPENDLDIQWRSSQHLLRALQNKGIKYIAAIPDVFPLVVKYRKLFEPIAVFPSKETSHKVERFMVVYQIHWNNLVTDGKGE
ncbi:MAG: hypothetical protein NZ937_03395 [Armatimonadetes bacterium]|nr:hypothetical protein [Armatimonadota bacterium]